MVSALKVILGIGAFLIFFHISEVMHEDMCRKNPKISVDCDPNWVGGDGW